MSVTTGQNRTAGRHQASRSGGAARVLKGLLALVLVGTAAACARPVGDFGRAQPSFTHDVVMPTVGKWRASQAGEPVSNFNQTDQERLMHDVVWRFLIAPHGRDWAFDTSVELQRTRIYPARDAKFTIDRYYGTLRSDAYQSSRVRYKRVGSDVETDVALMPAAFAAICDVIEVDRQRAEALRSLAMGSPMSTEAAARQAENAQYIDWFTRAVRYRYDSYSYALDHLLVETPHEEARAVDASLSKLLAYVDAAERADFCRGAGAFNGGHPSKSLPSRVYMTPRDYEGEYRK